MLVSCPICKKKTEWESNPFRPFCSDRCKTIDLAAWASEEYRIGGKEESGDDPEKE
jgi:endogenous inhibitor of DNA gyrase (YacG/DUF329 family)